MDDTTITVYRHRWTIAGVGGAIAFLLFWLSIGWGFLGALILGVVVFVLLLVVIGMIGTDEPTAEGSSFTATASPASASPDRQGSPGGNPVPPSVAGGGAAAGGGAPGATSEAMTGTPLGAGAGAETPEARRADEIAAANAEMAHPTRETPPVVPTSPASDRAADAAEGTVAPSSEAEASLSSDPVAMPPVEPPSEAAEEDRTLTSAGDPSGQDPMAEAVADAAGEGRRPETLDAPRGEGADDLKRIKGVGPKLEALCNRLGIWHFSQIAGWTEDEVAWVDQHLEGFKGRVRRDDWVEQARALAGERPEGTRLS